MHLLPTLSHCATMNMAVDMFMLEKYPQPDIARFRHYEWSKPAWSFGYSQKWSNKHELILELYNDVVRRPTGGGLVDHLQDWTYSLVIPAHHPLYSEKAILSYKVIHEALLQSLQEQNCEAMLKQTTAGTSEPENTTISDKPGISDICFETPEVYDIVHRSGAKIAGAAQKRTRDGLLLQGSINRLIADPINWGKFRTAFSQRIADLLESPLIETDFPQFNTEEVAQLDQLYQANEWNQRRSTTAAPA